MPCSNCKQEGHTKKTCKNPKVEPPQPQLNEPSNEVAIRLSDEVLTKFATLHTLCNEVASGLGKGYVEGVYQQALCSELQDANIRYVSEETMPILYKGRPIGGTHSQRLDIALMSYLPFIFELKAVSKTICPEHHWQLVRYMVYKNQPYGAVVNFNQSDKGTLEVQFIVLQDGCHYLYNTVTKGGTPLVDYGLVQGTTDSLNDWGQEWE